MVLHFNNYLTSDKIHSIANKFKFTDPVYLEKFIMDFEMGFHIVNKMECILRGGMCMPFHTGESIRRLSIDIDLLTKNTVKETDDIINNINDDLNEVEISKIVPKNPYPIDDISSYNVKYQSIENREDFVKIDFLCNAIDVPYDTIKTNYNILDFEIDYDLVLLNRGSLFADKLTSIATGTIGLPPHKFGDIPKQLYDLAELIKLCTMKEIKEGLEVFKKFTDFKISIYKKTPLYTIEEIVKSIHETILNLIDFSSTIKLSHEEDGRYSNFKSRYLAKSGRGYRKSQHIVNVMLMYLISKYIIIYLKNQNSHDIAEKLFQIISRMKEITVMDIYDKNSIRNQIIDELDENNLPFKKKIMNGTPTEIVYIIQEIFNA